jgi:hypothetical protein
MVVKKARVAGSEKAKKPAASVEMAHPKSAVRGRPPKDPSAPRRPVLTIQLPPKGMEILEGALTKFEQMRRVVPDWVPVPTTKASLASWLVTRYATHAAHVMMAILFENIEDRQAEDKPTEDEFLSLLKLEFGSTSDPKGINTYRDLLSSIKGDPFMQSLRHLVRLAQE